MLRRARPKARRSLAAGLQSSFPGGRKEPSRRRIALRPLQAPRNPPLSRTGSRALSTSRSSRRRRRATTLRSMPPQPKPPEPRKLQPLPWFRTLLPPRAPARRRSRLPHLPPLLSRRKLRSLPPRSRHRAPPQRPPSRSPRLPPHPPPLQRARRRWERLRQLRAKPNVRRSPRRSRSLRRARRKSRPRLHPCNRHGAAHRPLLGSRIRK